MTVVDVDLDLDARALDLEHVDKRLGGRLVLDDACLAFPGPGVLVIRGPNGAGKSTLLRVVAGVLDADRGDVRIGGASVARDRVRALRGLGYVPESPELPDRLTPRELAELVASLRLCAAPDAAQVDRIGVAEFLDRPLAGLSLGQRRRALLLAALAGDPPLLALDEPTNGLDAPGVAMLVELLRARAEAGGAAIVATHDAAFAEAVATDALTLVDGRLVR